MLLWRANIDSSRQRTGKKSRARMRIVYHMASRLHVWTSVSSVPPKSGRVSVVLQQNWPVVRILL